MAAHAQRGLGLPPGRTARAPGLGGHILEAALPPSPPRLPLPGPGAPRPAGDPGDEQEDGHHVTLVPVVLHVERELLHQVCVLIREESLAGVDGPVMAARAPPRGAWPLLGWAVTCNPLGSVTDLPDLLQHQREDPEVEGDLRPRRPLRRGPEVHQQDVGEQEEECKVHDHVPKEHGDGRPPELPPACEQESGSPASVTLTPQSLGQLLRPAPKRGHGQW